MKCNRTLRIPLLLKLTWSLCGLLLLASCNEDESDQTSPFLKNAFTYKLNEFGDSGLSGYLTFSQGDNGIIADIVVSGTVEGQSYPAHIHQGAAIETGDIVISFEPVNGSTGRSRTVFSQTDEGAAITLDDIQNFDGYVNVHKSADDLSIAAQTDIGSNVLSGTSKEYTLNAIGGSDIAGTVTFEKRMNGNTKVTISLDSMVANANFPAHIHYNTAAEGGSIAIDLAPVGSSGTSVTNVRRFNENQGGAAITYDSLLNFDGYINVHQGPEAQLAVVIAQTDIGANELTDKSVTYPLNPVAVPGIKGTATFTQRKNNETLVTIALEGTPANGQHPAHIHANTAVESGPIVIDLTTVDGKTGMSKTNVTALNDSTPINYDGLIAYNGYINVHESGANLGTIVAQGDIGGNALTEDSVVYKLDSVAVPSIKGTATFARRNNGSTLVTLALTGTPQNGMHPAHIHANSAAESGNIIIDLASVDGTTGMSKTSVATFNNGDSIMYEDLINYDGYINVHESATNLGTLVAQGDIGGNVLTGKEAVYPLGAVANSGASGTATFAERKNGNTLITLQLTGTGPVDHPAHIHRNSAAETGPITIPLQDVNAMTGMSKTHVEEDDNGGKVTYQDLLTYDGYINVHANALDLATVIAQGNIGANFTPEQ